MKRVLVTAIGSFSADIVIKELHKLNYEIIGCDIYNKDWVVDAKNVEYFEQVPLAINKEEYIKSIIKICEKYKISYIIPLTDIEVDILCDYEKICKSKNIIICISDSDVIKLCRNKLELYKKLKNICPENLIQTEKMEEKKEETISFPIIMKPLDGRSSQGLYKIYNKEQYSFYRNMNAGKNNIIIQPLIEGDIVTVDIVSDIKNNIVIAIPRRELLRTGNGAGTTVEIFYDSKLVDICKNIAIKLKIKGSVNMEFIENKGNYYFLEINPRFSGGVEFSNIAGYNVIENHIKCFNNIKIDKVLKLKKLVIARKYEEYIMRDDGEVI